MGQSWTSVKVLYRFDSKSRHFKNITPFLDKVCYSEGNGYNQAMDGRSMKGGNMFWSFVFALIFVFFVLPIVANVLWIMFMQHQDSKNVPITITPAPAEKSEFMLKAEQMAQKRRDQ